MRIRFEITGLRLPLRQRDRTFRHFCGLGMDAANCVSLSGLV